jgi:hypothetical protein
MYAMGAIDDIQTALLAKSAELTDALDKAECEAFIAEYIALRTAILALAGNTVSSYSIAGRSVTKADLPRLRLEAGGVRSQIARYISASGNDQPAVADFSWAGGLWQ